ncbi:MAG TPA: hypothetical protein VNT22_04475 [Baekduia sp.]|nr:hypothetical protein [Baekduia sp.]
MNNSARIAIGVAAVAAVVIAFVLAKGSDEAKTPTSSVTTTATTTTEATTTATTTAPTAHVEPQTVSITIKNAKPVGGIQKLEVTRGDRVAIKVSSDTADEIHVHGYDLAKDVAAGGSVTISFKATIEGKFEAELEEHREQILELTVNP